MKKFFKNFLRGLLVLVVALVVFLGGSIFVEGQLGSARVDALTNVRIASASGAEVRAFVAKPSAPGKYPAVIMIHEFWGIKADIVGKAKALAEEGYIVVAPDVMRGGSTSSLPRAIYQVASNSPQQVDADVDAVFTWLATQPDVQADKIAIMGFCFGGGTSLRYSVNSGKPAATVLFYGMPIVEADRLKNINGPVLGIFGGADVSIPINQVNALEAGLKAAGKTSEIKIYAEQPHAFVTDIDSIRKGGVQGEAWAQLLAFLKQSLQSGSAQPKNALAKNSTDGLDLAYVARLAWSHFGAHSSAHGTHVN